MDWKSHRDGRHYPVMHTKWVYDRRAVMKPLSGAHSVSDRSVASIHRALLRAEPGEEIEVFPDRIKTILTRLQRYDVNGEHTKLDFSSFIRDPTRPWIDFEIPEQDGIYIRGLFAFYPKSEIELELVFDTSRYGEPEFDDTGTMDKQDYEMIEEKAHQMARRFLMLTQLHRINVSRALTWQWGDYREDLPYKL